MDREEGKKRLQDLRRRNVLAMKASGEDFSNKEREKYSNIIQKELDEAVYEYEKIKKSKEKELIDQLLALCTAKNIRIGLLVDDTRRAIRANTKRINELLSKEKSLDYNNERDRYELEDIEKRLDWISEDVDELEKDAVDCKNDPSDLTEWERARAIELGKDKIIKLCQNEDELLKKYNKCINDLINLSMRSSVESFEIFKKLEMK